MRLLLLALAAGIAMGGADRRVVDSADAGDAMSELAHGYAGHLAASGTMSGKPFRQTTGWMRYALDVFDDTPVTVVLMMAGGDSVTREFDVVVEDSLVATRTVPASALATMVLEVAVPFSVTKGRANIAIVIRARGGVTPRLHVLRTLQDHNEL